MGLVLRREPIRLVPEVFYPGSEGPTVLQGKSDGVLNKVKVSGKGKREEPSIRIRDESLAS